MVNIKKSNIKINHLEKLIVNFALPLDVVYNCLKSSIVKNQYSKQTIQERIQGIYNGKISKYHKLLIIKERHHGKIPNRVQKICKDTPCGYVRLLLTYLH